MAKRSGNEIPSGTRQKVRARDRVCLVCGGPGAEINHRVRRREGGHSMGNLMLVCSVDHQRLHSNPQWARDRGYIVSAVADIDPASVPIRTHLGWALLRHDGKFEVIAPMQVKPEDLEEFLENALAARKERDAEQG